MISGQLQAVGASERYFAAGRGQPADVGPGGVDTPTKKSGAAYQDKSQRSAGVCMKMHGRNRCT
jgi:hypothetical protein